VLAQEYNERLSGPCDENNCHGKSFVIAVVMCISNVGLCAFHMLDSIYVIYREKIQLPILLTNDEYFIRASFTFLLVLNAIFACIAQILYFYYANGSIVYFNMIWTLLLLSAICSVFIREIKAEKAFCIMCQKEISLSV
jgi:hypothetical protein